MQTNVVLSSVSLSIDITLKIDESITARNLKVLIVNNRLEVHSKEDILLVGDFERKVKRDSLCWTVERSRKLCINIGMFLSLLIRHNYNPLDSVS